MLKKLLSALLALTILLLPLCALASDDYIVNLAGVNMKAGDYLHVGAEATADHAPADGTGYAHLSDNGAVLTLHNFDNQGKAGVNVIATNHTGALIIHSNLALKLQGTNTLTNSRHNGDGITTNDHYLTIDGGASDSLTIAAQTGIWQGAVTIDGGNISITSEYASLNGLSIFEMNGGSLSATATGESASAISAKYDCTINDGRLVLSGTRCAILCLYSIAINGGVMDLSAKNNYVVRSDEKTITCSLPLPDGVTIHPAGGGRSAVVLDWSDIDFRNFDEYNPRTIRLPYAPEPPAPAPEAPAPVPATGDSTPVALLAALCVLSAAGCLWLTGRKRCAH